MSALVIGHLMIDPAPMDGAEMREIRKDLELTAEEMGRLISRHPVSVSKYENDRDTIPQEIATLVRMVHARVVALDHQEERMDPKTTSKPAKQPDSPSNPLEGIDLRAAPDVGHTEAPALNTRAIGDDQEEA